MEEDKAKVIKAVGPDLLVSPHILPLLIELFAGDDQQAVSQQEQLLTHITTCHYCRTAVMVLLGYAREYDRRNNNPEEPTRDLLKRFVDISRTIEAREAGDFERLAAYAEAIVAKGREKAAQRFPGIAAHVNICADCRVALDGTVASLIEAEKTN